MIGIKKCFNLNLNFLNKRVLQKLQFHSDVVWNSALNRNCIEPLVLTQAKRSYSKNVDETLWVRSVCPDVEVVESQTIPEFLWEKVLQWQNLPAFECGETGQVTTYSSLYHSSRGFAASLLKYGATRGQVIALVLPNIPEFPMAALGSMEAGLVVSTINPRYTTHEISRQLINSEAKYVVTINQFLPTILKSQKSCPQLEQIIVIGPSVPEKCLAFYDMVKTDPQPFVGQFLRGSAIDPTQTVAFLPYSSGTTGLPKGVCLTHTNLATNVRQRIAPGVGSSSTPPERDGLQEKFMALYPLFHIAGFNLYNLTAIHQGAHTLCVPKFDATSFVEALKRHRPTILHLSPPVISFMCNSDKIGANELKSIHTITGGAAPVSSYEIVKLLKKAGKFILFAEAYGMTETSPITHQQSPSTKNEKIGSCGQPIPNTICKIVDISTGITLGPNKTGELCSRGPQVMKGYFKNEQATSETIDQEGWLHTGDIAYYDDSGHFYIVDRLKELIKVKGFQVAPSEHEDVLDVAVIGIPNDKYGQLPRAYVVTKRSELSANQLHNFIKDKITDYKQLKGGIKFINEIPKNPSGKILRRVLLDEYKTQNGLQ